MKVYYLSITSFSDVDLGILHHLREEFEITYGVVVQKTNANYSTEELESYCKEHDVNLETYRFTHQLKDPRSFKNFYSIVKSINDGNYDIVYIVSFDHIAFSVLSLLLDRKRTIVALHDVEFHSNAAFKAVLQASRKITMSFFKNFQVFSDNQYKIFQKAYPSKNVDLIPLPLKDFGPSAITTEIDTSKVRFLFFGNVLYYKGLDILISAINNISKTKSNYNFELVVAGRCDNWDTAYEPTVEAPQHIVKLIRFIKNEEIADLFATSHYLVLPYRDATQSGPLKIAMHYNVPIIASDIDSFAEEVTDGVDGYLFQADSVPDLEKVLVKTLENFDSEYVNLKINQQKYVEKKYSAAMLRKNFQDMFGKVTKGISAN